MSEPALDAARREWAAAAEESPRQLAGPRRKAGAIKGCNRAFEKMKSIELKKVSFKLNKFMSGLTKLKSEIKDEKLPHFMKEDNALIKLINYGKQLQDTIGSGDDEQEDAAKGDDVQEMRLKVDKFGNSCIVIARMFKAFK